MDKIGKFEIIEKIGRGAFGMVYKGKDSSMNRLAAIKVMGEATVGDPELVARFRREAEAAGGLSHRNIVTIYELGEHHGLPYIAMEFLEGSDLERLLKDKTEVAMDRKIDIIVQAAEGLHYAHGRGIVHRDVKPGNIRLLQDGTVKIMDFGIAKMSSSDMTKTGQFMGTVNYMSPEQIKAKRIDGRSDLFALGVVFYELVCGRRPFPGDSITAVIYKIVNENPAPISELHGTPYAWLEGVILKCLEKDANKRWPSCQELADALRAQTQVGVTLSESKADQAVRAVRKNIEDRDFTSAIRMIDEWLEQDPDNVTMNRERKAVLAAQAIHQSEQLTESGRLEQARDVLAMAAVEIGETEDLGRAAARVEEKIKAARAKQLLDTARRNLQEKRFDAALDLLKQARDLDRYNEEVRDALVHASDEKRKADVALLLADARARLERGQVEQARAQVDKAFELDPHSLDAKALRQEIERELDLGSRKKELDQALHQGQAAFKKGDLEGATKWSEKALALDPKSAEGRRLLDAIKQEKVKADEKKTVMELVDKGKQLLAQKRFDEARLSFERAQQLDPAWGDARLGVEAAKERRTSLEATIQRSVPVPVLAAVAVIAVVVIGYLAIGRNSEAAKALTQAKGELDGGRVSEARDLYKRAAELPGKDSEHGQAKAAFCGLYDRFIQDPRLAANAKDILDQCRSWNLGETGPERYLDLATSLANRGREASDPVLVKGALESYKVAFDKYDKARDYKGMRAVFDFGEGVFEQAQKHDLDPARRLALYTQAEELLDFVDKKEPSLNAFEDKNMARNQRVELQKASDRIAEFEARKKELLEKAAAAEKSESTMSEAIHAYDEVLNLVGTYQDIKDNLDLDPVRTQAEESRNGLQQRMARQLAQAGHEQKVTLLLGQASGLESSHDLKGALEKYQELLRDDPANATAQGKVKAINDALERARALKAEVRQALAARNQPEAQHKFDELAGLVSDPEVAGLQTEVSQLKARSDQEAAVAEKFKNAEVLLAGSRLDEAEVAFKEILGATTGPLNQRAADAIKRVREARVKAQMDPKIQSADALKAQGNFAGAIEVLREAQLINADYPGLRERLAELQKPLIEEKAKAMWAAFDARDANPGGFDQAVRALRELENRHPALAEVDAFRRASSAVASLNPSSALQALQPYAGDPRVKALRDQAEALRTAMVALDGAEREIAAGRRDEAVRLATGASQAEAQVNLPAFTKRAQDTLARAQAVSAGGVVAKATAPPPIEVKPTPVEVKPTPVEVKPTPPPPPAAMPGEVKQLAAAGNWAQAASLLDQHISGGGSADPAFAAKVFFNASHASVCDGACDLPGARKWAERAVTSDASVKRWLDGLGKVTGCGFQIQPACRAMPKRAL